MLWLGSFLGTMHFSTANINKIIMIFMEQLSKLLINSRVDAGLEERVELGSGELAQH